MFRPIRRPFLCFRNADCFSVVTIQKIIQLGGWYALHTYRPCCALLYTISSWFLQTPLAGCFICKISHGPLFSDWTGTVITRAFHPLLDLSFDDTTVLLIAGWFASILACCHTWVCVSIVCSTAHLTWSTWCVPAHPLSARPSQVWLLASPPCCPASPRDSQGCRHPTHKWPPPHSHSRWQWCQVSFSGVTVKGAGVNWKNWW